ncbi:MAG: hypothetical protein IIZ34_03335 [Eubacterium sp.]|nr:hypothetical protein [Eubacterium sp.]
MLQSKKGNLILALILAIALWAYVVGEKNPDVSKEYKSIPITITNSDILEDEDMAVASVSTSKLNVKLSGNRSVISKVNAEDIDATVDVSKASLGENNLKIHLKVPGNTYVVQQSITEVTVRVEQRVRDNKSVEVKYRGKTEEGVEPSLLGVDPEEVEVAGVEGRVSRVDHVQATVKVSKVGDSESSVKSTLTPVDKNGKKVENVSLSQKQAIVSSILYYTKEVPLDVPVNGDSDAKYERTVEAPETIVVKGDSAVLETMDSITAEPVDISNITEDKKIKIIPVLPEGITVARESEKLYLTVSVKSLLRDKTVTLDPAAIGISGVGEGLSAEVISTDITVKLTGTSEALESVDAASISASCDVSGLAEGTHKVALKVSSSVKNVQVDDHTGKVQVKLTADPGQKEGQE